MCVKKVCAAKHIDFLYTTNNTHVVFTTTPTSFATEAAAAIPNPASEPHNESFTALATEAAAAEHVKTEATAGGGEGGPD